MRGLRTLILSGTIAVALGGAAPLLAGFAGTDVFIPAVARANGGGGSQFYSTVWITNTSSSMASVQIDLLLQGQANPGPISRSVSVPGGATKRLDNIVSDLFGVSGTGAALRVRSDQKVLVSSRTFDQPAGSQMKDTKGLFLSGIPASLAIGLGQSTTLQGISTSSTEAFRYNFGLVETTGQGATVNVTVKDENGRQLSSVQQYLLGQYEARQIADFAGFNPPISTSNAVVQIDVVAGSGKVIAYGTQIAGTNDSPGSNDSSGFEMQFAEQSNPATVTSLNGLTGALNIKAGSNVTVTNSGADITINATGVGGPPTITGVAAGAGLTGGGTSGNVTLGVAQGGITNAMVQDGAITSSKLADGSVTASKLAAGLIPTMVAAYYRVGGQNMPASAWTVIDFSAKEIDTHNAVATGPTWWFAAPLAGYYQVDAQVSLSYGTGCTAISLGVWDPKGAVAQQTLPASSNGIYSIRMSRAMWLKAGDGLNVRLNHDCPTARTLWNDTQYSYITITRIGS